MSGSWPHKGSGTGHISFFEFHSFVMKVLLLHNALLLHSLLADTQFEHMSVKNSKVRFWRWRRASRNCSHSIDLQIILLKTTETYLLTPWCRVLLEKLTGLQLVKKFPAFYGTRRFITSRTGVRHPSLSWPVQSSPHTHIPPPGDPS